MGLNNWLAKVFGGKGSKTDGKQSGLSSVYSFAPFASNYLANYEANSTYMGCIHSFSRIVSKIYPEVVINGNPNKQRAHLQYILGSRPNEIQNAVNFWKQVSDNYHSNNVAVIWLDWDYTTAPRTLRSMWCIDTSESTFQIKSINGKAYFRFMLDSREMEVPSDELCVLTFSPSHENPYCTYNTALNQVISGINSAYEGMEKELKTSALIRFIAQSPSKMSKEELATRSSMISSMLSSMTSGVFNIDNVATLTPVNQPQFAGSAMAEELKQFKNDVYDYFGMSASIVNASATDDQYQSFIEMSVEPFTYELSVELTNKIFTEKERSLGNEIIVDTGQLFTASQSHRIQSAQILIQSAKFYPNEIRSIMGLPLMSDEDNQIINRTDRIDSSGADKGGKKDGDQEKTGA